jgi:hypothetical protein
MSHRNLNQICEITNHVESIKDKANDHIALIDAQCQVEQAQGLLSVWMEANISDDITMTMIGALMTLLKGVPKSMQETDAELSDYILADYIARKG